MYQDLNIKSPAQWPHILRCQLCPTATTVGMVNSTATSDTDFRT